MTFYFAYSSPVELGSSMIQVKRAKCTADLGLDRDLLALNRFQRQDPQMVGGIWENVPCGSVPRTMTTFSNQMPILRRNKNEGASSKLDMCTGMAVTQRGESAS